MESDRGRTPEDSSRSYFAKVNLSPELASEQSMILAAPLLSQCSAAQPTLWF
jgi:hypothetical protein